MQNILIFDSSWEIRIFSLSHARDKTKKKSFSISLPCSKLTISLISIYKQYAVDIADPSSMQDACHSHSLWLSGRALKRGIRLSEV